MGIAGNEAADCAAKDAAGGQVTESKKLPWLLRKDLPWSKSASKQDFHTRLKDAALTAWRTSAQFQRRGKILSNKLTKRHRETLTELPRGAASIWTQVRTAHVPLNAHVHRIHVADSPTCQRCFAYNKTVEHVLLHCPTYNTQRRTIRQHIRRARGSVGKLLSSNANAVPIVNFIAATHRFPWLKLVI